MIGFLRGLLEELVRRLRLLDERLAAVPERTWTKEVVAQAREHIERLVEDVHSALKDIDKQGYAASLSRRYRRFDGGARLIEYEVVPFVEHFNDMDGLLSLLAQRMAEEVRWPLSAPIVGTCATEYWSTAARYNLVFASALEGTTLLSLPDLVHEMGHALVKAHARTVMGEWDEKSLMTFISEIDPEMSEAELKETAYNWHEYWLSEFCCDLIATFVLGPAYVWQHLRLCAAERALSDPGDVSHPGDEVRMLVMERMLRKMGLDEDASAVGQVWAEYPPASPPMNGVDADRRRYPEPLLNLLVDQVHAGCTSLSVREYSSDRNGFIVSLLAEAWHRFCDDPSTYGEWEAGALEGLKRHLADDKTN